MTYGYVYVHSVLENRLNVSYILNIQYCIQTSRTYIHSHFTCTSSMYTISIYTRTLGERGLGVFKGRIRIPKHAQETDSDQLCRSIMLSDKARVIAMPTLEITADNVVCSHGASVADLDPNSLFYITSRGISRPV